MTHIAMYHDGELDFAVLDGDDSGCVPHFSPGFHTIDWAYTLANIMAVQGYQTSPIVGTERTLLWETEVNLEELAQ